MIMVILIGLFLGMCRNLSKVLVFVGICRDLYRIVENKDIDRSDLQLKLNEKSDGDLQLQLGKISAAGQSDGDQQNSAKKLCTIEWKNGWVMGIVAVGKR
jgi:hypothetical protein